MSADTRESGIELFRQWTGMWNGELTIADRILAPALRVRFGNALPTVDSDAFGTPEDIKGFVKLFRDSHTDLRYFVEGTPVVELASPGGPGTHQVVSRWYSAYRGPGGKPVANSGIDQLAFRDGLITEVWSVTGNRTFATVGAVGALNG
ncbi:hypothetical protein ACIHEI_01105 [Kitasatospora sp. NPDC051984]|uniref:hypothetical protein n=1 Tax=Kitasatospora sp. NPDC051984 TaxID=3364059 RepID=UPI0037CA9364